MITAPDDKSTTDENLIVETEKCKTESDCIEDITSNKIIDIDEVNVVIDESLTNDNIADTS